MIQKSDKINYKKIQNVNSSQTEILFFRVLILANLLDESYSEYGKIRMRN